MYELSGFQRKLKNGKKRKNGGDLSVLGIRAGHGGEDVAEGGSDEGARAATRRAPRRAAEEAPRDPHRREQQQHLTQATTDVRVARYIHQRNVVFATRKGGDGQARLYTTPRVPLCHAPSPPACAHNTTQTTPPVPNPSLSHSSLSRSLPL